MQPDWPAEVHRELAAAGVRVVGYVPDAGHKRLIELCQADRKMRAVPLSTEEEGIGLACGAWLGGEKSVLLMQSSGVGNCINPWQVPMGEGTPRVLETMGIAVRQAGESQVIAAHVRTALTRAFEAQAAEAVLISQKVIGIKSFQEQRSQ
jgi:sulfopyruvate decarboxylase TPP-binding subunit